MTPTPGEGTSSFAGLPWDMLPNTATQLSTPSITWCQHDKHNGNGVFV